MIRRLLLLGLALLVLGALLAWQFGPRVPVDPTVRFDADEIADDPVAFLTARENAVPGLTSQTAKEIVWADPARRERTPLAIVYVHGYSGDKRELRPVPDRVAEKLGANLFFTRLSGHGLDFAALAEPTANDWLNDVVEALEIGRRLGDRVILMSASTGGTLNAWAASLGLTEDVAAMVMVSPNFALRDWRARLATLPFAQEALPYLVGRGFELQLAEPNDDGSRTAVFPSRALLPMAALVEAVRGLDFEAMRVPALFVYSPEDEVVNPLATEAIVGRWGAAAEILLVENSQDPYHHMIAGDFFSPSTTEPVAQAIVQWIETTLDVPAGDRPSESEERSE